MKRCEDKNGCENPHLAEEALVIISVHGAPTTMPVCPHCAAKLRDWDGTGHVPVRTGDSLKDSVVVMLGVVLLPMGPGLDEAVAEVDARKWKDRARRGQDDDVLRCVQAKDADEGAYAWKSEAVDVLMHVNQLGLRVKPLCGPCRDLVKGRICPPAMFLGRVPHPEELERVRAVVEVMMV